MNPALELRLLARVRVDIGEFILPGEVPAGQRRVIPITGGAVEGPELFGEVVPLGADWNLARTDGSETVLAHYLIRTRDGVVLSVRNEGVIRDRPSGRMGITVLEIEAPIESDYAWLNETPLVGSLVAEEHEGSITVCLEYWYAAPADEAPQR